MLQYKLSLMALMSLCRTLAAALRLLNPMLLSSMIASDRKIRIIIQEWEVEKFLIECVWEPFAFGPDTIRDEGWYFKAKIKLIDGSWLIENSRKGTKELDGS